MLDNSHNLLIWLMESGDMKDYEATSILYKELVAAITEKELTQLNLNMVYLQKWIKLGKEPILAQHKQVKDILDTLRENKGKVALHFTWARDDLNMVRFLIEGTGLITRLGARRNSLLHIGQIQIPVFGGRNELFGAGDKGGGDVCTALHHHRHRYRTEITNQMLLDKGVYQHQDPISTDYREATSCWCSSWWKRGRPQLLGRRQISLNLIFELYQWQVLDFLNAI